MPIDASTRTIGPSSASRSAESVKAFTLAGGSPAVLPGPVGSFFAFDPAERGGVQVAADDVDGDGTPDLIAGEGDGQLPLVKVVSGTTGAVLTQFQAFGDADTGGVRVSAFYLTDDDDTDIVAGTGPGDGRVRVFDGPTGAPLAGPVTDFRPFGPGAAGGVWVAAQNDPHLYVTVLGTVAVQTTVVEGEEVGVDVSIPGDPAPGAPAPTGDVTLSVGGVAVGTGTVAPVGAVDAAVTVPVSALTAGTVTLDVSYAGDAHYAAATGSVTVTVGTRSGPAVIAPVARSAALVIAPVGTGPKIGPPGGGGGDGPLLPPHPKVVAPAVRPADGSFTLIRQDLAGRVGDRPWAQTWAWTNAAGYADGAAGVGSWTFARMVQGNGDNSLVAIDAGGISDGPGPEGPGAPSAHFFDLYSGTPGGTAVYHSRFGEALTLVADGTAHLYKLTDNTGTRYDYYDYSAYTPTGRAGQLKQITDPAGYATAVTSWDSATGRPAEVQQTDATPPGTTSDVTESFLYTYLTTGTNTGKVASVLQRRAVGGGTWQAVRSVEYTYYGTADTYGSAGDLKFAVLKDAGGSVIDTSYYRYYTGDSTTGYTHGLRYAFGGPAYGRLTGALGTGVDALSDAQVAPYADHYLEYDGLSADHRVTRHRAAGEGDHTFSYNLSGPLTVPLNLANGWSQRTTETLPDSTTSTYYLNGFGETMVRAYAAGGSTWRWASYYDAQGRVTLSAGPASVTGLSTALLDLLGYSGSGTSTAATYLSDTAGPIADYVYGGSTTATSSTAGSVAGFLASSDLRRGDTGTPVPQSAAQYVKRTVSGVDLYFPAAETAYRNDNGTGAATVTTAYTWQGTTAQPDSVTTTYPVVTTGQNGPGGSTGATATAVFDPYGRPVWMKDADGFLAYVAYDPATSSVTRTIVDVNTATTADFANLPSGWATPSGGGLHLKSDAEVDDQGRATKVTDPAGHVTYAVFKDAGHEVRLYPGWDSSTSAPTGPTQVIRQDRTGNYTEALSMSAAPTVSGGRPTGTEAIGSLQSLSRAYGTPAGQTDHLDDYFHLAGLSYTTAALGTLNTDYYRTTSGYDARGRSDRSVTPAGTVTRAVYDGLDRLTSTWVGTDDSPTTGTWSPTNTAETNLVKTGEYEYDGGGVGDSDLTKVTTYPGLGAAARVTQAWYDWRDRPVAVKDGVQTTEGTGVNRPLAYTQYDNRGQVTSVERYDADAVTPTVTGGVPDRPSASLLRAKTAVSYDELGQVYRTQEYGVDPSSGAVTSTALTTNVWYDNRGQVVKVAEPGGLVTKTTYDGSGRVTAEYLTDGNGDGGWADALNVTGDAVLEQAGYTYDANGNLLLTTTRRRFHDETTSGALGDAATAPKARVSYQAGYYDLADRLTAGVDVGTNGGSAYTRPSTVPNRSDTVLVDSVVYDAAGRAWKATDPRGIETRTEYDALGRTTRTIENYVDGTVSNADDKTTDYAYGPAGLTSLTARLTGTGVQTTGWVYGVTQAGGSGIDSNDLVVARRWPDPATGAASSSQQDTATVNALGEPVTTTDRNGTVHALTYDVLGRLTADAVTTLATGVDGAVRRVETAYDGQGNASLVTTYNAASGGSVLTQVQRDFNGWGQLTSEWQSHSGAVTTGTPRVQYAYTEMAGGANHSRPTSMTYPNGRVVGYAYSTGLNDAISRLSSLTDSGTTLESNDYLGLDTVVRQAHPQPGIDLTYIKQSGESSGDAGDPYTGLDRFDRVADQRWLVASTGTAVDRYQYGFDRDSNPLYRDNLVSAAFGELYAYDGLNQLTSFQRGTLNGTKTGLTGSASRSQSWSLDPVGNWASVTTDGTAQTRTHNAQNEVTGVSGATSPTFDAAGNTTKDQAGQQYVYDAWGRVAAVKDSGGTTIATYAYDGLDRRVARTAGGTTTDLYYSAAWRLLEERVGGAAKTQYVWSAAGQDVLVERDRDADGNSGTGPGGLEERLYALRDANGNVTALVNTSGTVVERYVYDPYGAVTVLDASWAVRSGGTSYAWEVLFQGLKRDPVTGVYHARFRDVQPALGRPLQADPLGFGAGDQNLYRWEGNGPAGRADPAGLAWMFMPFLFLTGGGITAAEVTTVGFGGAVAVGGVVYFKHGPRDISGYDDIIIHRNEALAKVISNALDNIFGTNISNSAAEQVNNGAVDREKELDALARAFKDGRLKEKDLRKAGYSEEDIAAIKDRAKEMKSNPENPDEHDRHKIIDSTTGSNKAEEEAQRKLAEDPTNPELIRAAEEARRQREEIEAAKRRSDKERRERNRND